MIMTSFADAYMWHLAAIYIKSEHANLKRIVLGTHWYFIKYDLYYSYQY